MMSQRVEVLCPFSMFDHFQNLGPMKTPDSLISAKGIPHPLSQSSEGKVAHSGSRGRRTASSVRGRDTLPPHGNSTPQGQKSSIIPSSLEIVPPGLRYGLYGEYSPEAKSGIFLVRAFSCKSCCVKSINQFCYHPSVVEYSSEKLNEIETVTIL